jgi:hypothetical protein
MRLFKMLAIVLLVVVPATALAQKSVLNTPAASGASSEPAGLPDHELVVGAFGARVETDVAAPTPLTVIGVRYWLNNRFGIDGGVGLYFHHVPNVNQFSMGFAAGVPIVLSQFKHISFNLRPNLGFAFFHVGKGNNQWAFGLGADVGSELTLGWIGVPLLAFTASMGAGLTVTNDGNNSDIVFRTVNGRFFGTAVAANVGVIYYF